MKKIFILLSAFFFGLSAQAQTASVDMNLVSQQYWKSIAEQKNLSDQNQALNEKAQQIQASYQNVIGQMKELDSSLKDSLMLSDEKKAEMQSQLGDLKKQAMTMKQQLDGMGQQFEAMVKKTQSVIISEIRAAVRIVAQEKAVSVVYEAETVLYAEVDLTEEVIKELNKDAPVQLSN